MIFIIEYIFWLQHVWEWMKTKRGAGTARRATIWMLVPLLPARGLWHQFRSRTRLEKSLFSCIIWLVWKNSVVFTGEDPLLDLPATSQSSPSALSRLSSCLLLSSMQTGCWESQVRQFLSVLWIRILIRMDPQHFGNLDPHSDPHLHQIKIRIRIRIHIKVISWILN